MLALNAPSPNAIYNLGTGRGTSVNEIFSSLKGIIGYSRDAVHGPAKLGETRRIYLDAGRARQALGWAPCTALDMGLRQTVDYFRRVELDRLQVREVRAASVATSAA